MAVTAFINFNICCRLCLSNTIDNLKSVFDENTNDVRLQQMISDLLGIEIMANDKLSTLVCSPCIEKINSWQIFKTNCFENQSKLEQWINISNNNLSGTSDMIVPIKAEPVEQEVPDIVNCAEIMIKNEAVEEEYDDLPPPLTPQRPEETDDMEVSVQSPSSSDDEDSRRCSVCAKMFSSIGNLRKHQRNIHGIKSNISFVESNGCRTDSTNKDETSHVSINLQSVEQNPSTSKLEKITSDGKQLLPQRNSTKKDEYNDSCLYCCPECDGMFDSTEWEKHKETHTKKTCNECGKVFQFESELDQHKSAHQNLRRSSRSRTKRSFESTSVSIPGNKSDTTMMCQICDKIFTSKKQFQEHKQTHEIMPILEVATLTDEDKKAKMYSCKLCDKQYTRRGGLWAHNKRKHPENGSKKSKSPKKEESSHTCKICFKNFAHKASLTKHMKCHTSNSRSSETPNSKKTPKKVWCDICHYSFDTATDLNKHKSQGHARIDDDNNMPVLSDERGNKGDAKKYKDQDHVPKLTKNKQTPLRCKYCKLTFVSQNQLTSHTRNEHKEAPKPKYSKDNGLFTCDLCHKSFNFLAALYGHQGWHARGKYSNVNKARESPNKEVPPKLKKATKASQFRCSTCRVVLHSEKALKDHILEKHDVSATVLLVRCKMCNLDFSTKSEYEQHKSLHAVTDNRSKSYRCSDCGSVFNHLDTFKVHVQMHQTQVLKCSLCDRVFEKQNSLNIHLKVHEKQRSVTGGKPVTNSNHKLLENVPVYSCSICNKRFDLPKDLKTHTIQEHPF